MTEAFAQRCSMKKMLLKISQNLEEKNIVGIIL